MPTGSRVRTGIEGCRHEGHQALLEGSAGAGGELAGVRVAGGCGRIGSGPSGSGAGGTVTAGEIAPCGERGRAECSAGKREGGTQGATAGFTAQARCRSGGAYLEADWATPGSKL